jgi:bacterioferritin (cytochrome b1)
MNDNKIIISVLNKILPTKNKSRNEDLFFSKESVDLKNSELSEEIKQKSNYEEKEVEDLIKRSVFQEVWRTPDSSKNKRKENL